MTWLSLHLMNLSVEMKKNIQDYSSPPSPSQVKDHNNCLGTIDLAPFLLFYRNNFRWTLNYLRIAFTVEKNCWFHHQSHVTCCWQNTGIQLTSDLLVGKHYCYWLSASIYLSLDTRITIDEKMFSIYSKFSYHVATWIVYSFLTQIHLRPIVWKWRVFHCISMENATQSIRLTVLPSGSLISSVYCNTCSDLSSYEIIRLNECGLSLMFEYTVCLSRLYTHIAILHRDEQTNRLRWHNGHLKCHRLRDWLFVLCRLPLDQSLTQTISHLPAAWTNWFKISRKNNTSWSSSSSLGQ